MAASAKDHYKVLGVERNASEAEIKRAYRKRARELHPDKNHGRIPEATVEFQELQRAHETLTNPQKRARYDGQYTKRYSDGAQFEENSCDNESSDECQFDSYFYFFNFFANSSRQQDVRFQPTVAIKDLNITQQVTIRARVTNKTEVKYWSNSDRDGKLFKMDLLDDSGEIRMTGFDFSVDLFYHRIEVNRVYNISSFIVKPANKRFTSIKHDYEITFSDYTQVKLCVEDTSNIPQQVAYNFVRISDIEHVDVGKSIDVIGVCKSVGDCSNVILRKTKKNVHKRELVLIDDTCKEIMLTLWGKTAEDFFDDTKPVVAVKGVQVSGFGGKSISLLSASLFKVNPDLERAHALRKWYDSEGFRLTTQSSSSARGKGQSETTTNQ